MVLHLAGAQIGLELVMVLKRLWLLLPVASFLLCGWLTAPPELRQAVTSVWFTVVVSMALSVIVALIIGLIWLWNKAKQAAIIAPDPNGNFGLIPVRGGGYQNLNLVGADVAPYAWAVWEYSTAKTSQPNLEQPPRLSPVRMITSDSEASGLMLEGKAKVVKL